MILFENKGEIDIRSIKTFGTSVKVNENPIGFFGTGLKYALAILMRKECAVILFSGKNKYVFSTRTERIRDQEFEAVYMNDEMLAFTTELGKTWELWMAYRELYCNTLDEQGTVTPTSTKPQGAVGTTRLYVSGLKEIHDDRYSFLLGSKPLFRVNDNISMHPVQGRAGIYLKGVCVGRMADAEYSYNFESHLELSEDRTVKSEYNVKCKIAEAVIQSNNKNLIKTFITAPEGSYEDSIDFSSHTYRSPSAEFIDVAGAVTYTCNKSAARIFKAHALSRGMTVGITKLGPVQQKMLDRAIDVCDRYTDFERDRYPIIVTDFLGENVCGQATNGMIYVSKKAFDMGTKLIAQVLYEEYIHLKYDLSDETRTMQNHILGDMFTIIENQLLQEAI